jgi:hypothetical protein
VNGAGDTLALVADEPVVETAAGARAAKPGRHHAQAGKHQAKHQAKHKHKPKKAKHHRPGKGKGHGKGKGPRGKGKR